MGNKYFKDNPISPVVQLVMLKQLFPGSKGSVKNNLLTWIANFIPSPMSQEYSVKIMYKLKSAPKIYVIKPTLVKPEGEKLPHVYPGDRLCLYYPKHREWHSKLHLADTIVPWISEWLLHYEIWLATGKWHGRGEHQKSGMKEE